MGKHKFITEYEFEYDSSQLFPYLSTAEGLTKWFAESVNPLEDKLYDIVWDKSSHIAKISAFRANNHIKYQFYEENGKKDFAYIDFKLNRNPMTETTFLQIVDYSDMTDEIELRNLWDMLIDDLREAIQNHNDWESFTQMDTF